MLEKRLKNLKIPISLISFVNNSLFVSQEKYLNKTISNLFCSYNIFSLLLKHFGLVIEHGKSEIFHFSRAHRLFNSPLLDLSTLRGFILHSKDI